MLPWPTARPSQLSDHQGLGSGCASAIASANLAAIATSQRPKDGTVTIGQSLTGDQVNNPLSRPVVMDGVVGADRNLLTADDLEAMASKLAAILAELAMDAVEAGESDVWRSPAGSAPGRVERQPRTWRPAAAPSPACWPPPRRQPCWRGQ